MGYIVIKSSTCTDRMGLPAIIPQIMPDTNDVITIQQYECRCGYGLSPFMVYAPQSAE